VVVGDRKGIWLVKYPDSAIQKGCGSGAGLTWSNSGKICKLSKNQSNSNNSDQTDESK